MRGNSPAGPDCFGRGIGAPDGTGCTKLYANSSPKRAAALQKDSQAVFDAGTKFGQVRFTRPNQGTGRGQNRMRAGIEAACAAKAKRDPQLPYSGNLRRSRSRDLIIMNMDINLVFKIAAIGIIVSILNQVLSRSGREEQATMTSLAGLVVVLMMLAQKIAELFDLVKTLFEF